ncbi:MAG TPA: hypothetical protein VK081_06515 [Planctomycetota bacterium]|nr:hypothetical protein [Planctomycetota bacterium]
MTLGDEEVLATLRDRFVVGWHNIWRERWVGESHGYSRAQSAVGTTNGAGGRNMQIFVLSPDLVVLHALPGFWHPKDFLHELHFAQGLAAVWADPNLNRAQKDRLFRTVQRAEVGFHGEETVARSGWQHFDAHAERARLRQGARDTFAIPVCAGDGDAAIDAAQLKPINVLVHERMAEQPFVPFAEFDVEALVDYGRPFYDNNMGRDHGVKLPKPPPKRSYRHWL